MCGYSVQYVWERGFWIDRGTAGSRIVCEHSAAHCLCRQVLAPVSSASLARRPLRLPRRYRNVVPCAALRLRAAEPEHCPALRRPHGSSSRRRAFPLPWRRPRLSVLFFCCIAGIRPVCSHSWPHRPAPFPATPPLSVCLPCARECPTIAGKWRHYCCRQRPRRSHCNCSAVLESCPQSLHHCPSRSGSLNLTQLYVARVVTTSVPSYPPEFDLAPASWATHHPVLLASQPRARNWPPRRIPHGPGRGVLV